MRPIFRRMHRAAALTGLALLTCTLPALAQDYPYDGLFWLSVGGQDGAMLDRRCALSFLEQRKDGGWAVYHVDLDAFTGSGTISYHKVSEGKCSFTPETRVEACVATMDKSFPEGEGQVVYDVVTATTADQIDTVMIDAASGWETVMQDPANPDVGYPLTYLRCPFPAEALLSRVSDQPTAALADDLNALRFPADELVASPEVALLVEALRAQ